MSERLIERWWQERSTGSGNQTVLTIRGRQAPWSGIPENGHRGAVLGFSLRQATLAQTLYCHNLPVVQLSTSNLPIQDDEFSEVVLWHLVSSGEEP